MKTNLTDVTFLFLIRLDSIQRLENILIVIEKLNNYFYTNINVCESASYNNGILKKMLNTKTNYLFVEDKDPILHKTKYFNQMTQCVKTPFLAIWDADIVIDKKAIFESVKKLRDDEADVVYPYNGQCLEISPIIRNYYIKKKNSQFLLRQKGKLDLLYPHLLAGGAVFIKTQKYIDCNMENEKYYGWGNDDFDRYFRFIGFDYRIYRVDTYLFHLWHPRGDNSKYRAPTVKMISDNERFKIENSSKSEIVESIKQNENTPRL